MPMEKVWTSCDHQEKGHLTQNTVYTLLVLDWYKQDKRLFIFENYANIFKFYLITDFILNNHKVEV